MSLELNTGDAILVDHGNDNPGGLPSYGSSPPLVVARDLRDQSVATISGDFFFFL